MKFVLEIELGNDAMLTASHVAKALHEVADKLPKSGRSIREMSARRIFDVNGNTVGHWEVREK